MWIVSHHLIDAGLEGGPRALNPHLDVTYPEGTAGSITPFTARAPGDEQWISTFASKLRYFLVRRPNMTAPTGTAVQILNSISVVEHGGFEPPTPCLPGKITCVVVCRLVPPNLGRRRRRPRRVA